MESETPLKRPHPNETKNLSVHALLSPIYFKNRAVELYSTHIDYTRQNYTVHQMNQSLQEKWDLKR